MLKYVASKDDIERYRDVNSYHSINVKPIRAIYPKPVTLNFKHDIWCQHCYLDKKVD